MWVKEFSGRGKGTIMCQIICSIFFAVISLAIPIANLTYQRLLSKNGNYLLVALHAAVP